MDKYDEAVAYLTAHPEQIVKAWGQDTSGEDEPTEYPCGIFPPDYAATLFAPVSDTGMADTPMLQPNIPVEKEYCRGYCGCLTQVAAGTHLAQFADLTIAIRADKRIPTDPEHITVADLPVFAEWQRRIDQDLGRTADDHE